MILSDEQFVLELEPDAYIYFALKDSKGNHTEVMYIDWEDLKGSNNLFKYSADLERILNPAPQKHLN